MSGLLRYSLAGAVLAAGLGAAALHAQTVLGDPRDAARTFATNCSACHKSPRGLAKSGQVAGFLRQHYTTGPEMSAAMAAYLVSAGAAPPDKKSAAKEAKEDGAPGARTKGKKEHQLTAVPDGTEHRMSRGKQRPAPHEEAAPPAVQQQSAAPDPAPQVAATAASAGQPAAAVPSPPPVAAAAPTPPPVVLNIPLPELPEGPPADFAQSAFSSSPVP